MEGLYRRPPRHVHGLWQGRHPLILPDPGPWAAYRVCLQKTRYTNRLYAFINYDLFLNSKQTCGIDGPRQSIRIHQVRKNDEFDTQHSIMWGEGPACPTAYTARAQVGCTTLHSMLSLCRGRPPHEQIRGPVRTTRLQTIQTIRKRPC